MKVKELIAKLQEQNPEMKVTYTLKGYEVEIDNCS